MLTFDSDRHEYRLDGALLPSVTQIIKPLADYSMVPADVLERAASYGTAVHQMIALEIAGTLDYGTLDDGLMPALEAFGRWKADYPELAARLSVSTVEKPMANARLRFAGTPDIIIDGLLVIDIKTRPVNALADAIQCAAYENLWTANSGTKAKYEHRILRIDPAGTYTFQKVNHREAWSRFRFLLDHHNNLKTIDSWR